MGSESVWKLEIGIWKLEIGNWIFFLGDFVSKTVPKQFQNSSETGSESSLAQFQIISKIIFRSQPLVNVMNGNEVTKIVVFDVPRTWAEQGTLQRYFNENKFPVRDFRFHGTTAFVSFDTSATRDLVLARPHSIDGVRLRLEKAKPRGNSYIYFFLLSSPF